jgi:hypothetical protein
VSTSQQSQVLTLTFCEDIYTNGGNQAMMIKGNGGGGYVQNVLLQNFISRGTAYGLVSLSGTVQHPLTSGVTVHQSVRSRDMNQPLIDLCSLVPTLPVTIFEYGLIVEDIGVLWPD